MHKMKGVIGRKIANQKKVFGEDLKVAGDVISTNGNFVGSDTLGNVLTQVGRATMNSVDQKKLYEN